MIIEMLLHDVPRIEDLDKKLTELGFGQGNIISDGYKTREIFRYGIRYQNMRFNKETAYSRVGKGIHPKPHRFSR